MTFQDSPLQFAPKQDRVNEIFICTEINKSEAPDERVKTLPDRFSTAIRARSLHEMVKENKKCN